MDNFSSTLLFCDSFSCVNVEHRYKRIHREESIAITERYQKLAARGFKVAANGNQVATDDN